MTISSHNQISCLLCLQELSPRHPDGQELFRDAVVDDDAGPDALREHQTRGRGRLQPLLLLLQVVHTAEYQLESGVIFIIKT